LDELLTIVTSVFCGFPQLLQLNGGIVPSNRQYFQLPNPYIMKFSWAISWIKW